MVHIRVARWFVLKPKIPIWANFGGGVGMENVVIFYNHLEYFMAIWHNVWQIGIHSLWSLGIFFQFWYVWTMKNLATMVRTPFSNTGIKLEYSAKSDRVIFNGKSFFSEI
jgi:hypothetical protein